jgi:hypothetical protein
MARTKQTKRDPCSNKSIKNKLKIFNNQLKKYSKLSKEHEYYIITNGMLKFKQKPNLEILEEISILIAGLEDYKQE